MEVHYKSEKHTWETPQEFFNNLNEIFNFNLDSFAEHETAKLDKYYPNEPNALEQDWFGNVWCNPPYGREQVNFIKKACEESCKNGATVVMLIPARPDTKVWQDVIFKKATSVCFIKGRLKFGNSNTAAPFPSAIVVFNGTQDLSRFGKQVYLN